MSDRWTKRLQEFLQARRPHDPWGRRRPALLIGEEIPQAWRSQWETSWQLFTVRSPEEAIELLQVEDYDLVVLNLKGLRGRPEDLIASIRAYRSMPIVVVGGAEDRPLVADALRAGADDCLWLDRSPWEATLILTHAVERTALLRTRGDEAPATQRDFVTGLLNPEAFSEVYRSVVSRSRQFGERLGAIVVRVLGLDGIAAAYGPASRDRVLQEIAAALRSLVRRTDVVARTGEDRFAILLPGTSAERLERVARGIPEAVARRLRPDLRIELRVGWAMREDDRDVLEAAEHARAV